MGWSDKKTTSTSTSDSTAHVTQTPTNPDWVTNGLGALGGSIMDLSKTDPTSYVAPADPLQTQAGSTLSRLTGSPFNFDAAADVTRGAIAANPDFIKGASALDSLQGFMNPYTDSVVKTTLQGFDDNANQTRQGLNLGLAGDSTFGGSGGAITKALTEGQLSQQRAATEAGLRSQGFDTALSASQQEADRAQAKQIANQTAYETALQRQLAGGAQLADLSTAYDANQRANAGAQDALGSDLRSIDQQRATSPLTLLGLQASLFGGLPLSLLHGQTGDTTEHSTSTGTTTQSDPFGALGSLLSAGGSLAQGLGSLGLSFGGGPPPSLSAFTSPSGFINTPGYLDAVGRRLGGG